MSQANDGGQNTRDKEQVSSQLTSQHTGAQPQSAQGGLEGLGRCWCGGHPTATRLRRMKMKRCLLRQSIESGGLCDLGMMCCS